MPAWAQNSVGTKQNVQILPYGSLWTVCQSSRKACLRSRGRATQCSAATLWWYWSDWSLSNHQGAIDFPPTEPTRCLRHLLAASWQTLMPVNQQLTQTDANALCRRGWVTHAQIDPSPMKMHNVISTVLSFWIMSRTRGMPQMGSLSSGILQPECRQEKYGMIEKSTVHKPRKAVCSCSKKKKTTKAKYRYNLQAIQHCRSVVISVCHDSASVSSFSGVVTCSGPGIQASCPYHQFR